MKIGLVLSAAALGVAAVAVAAKPVQDAKAQGQGQGEMEQMGGDTGMDAWIKAGTPGEMHAKMARAVGTWKTHSKSYMNPSEPPEEADGTSTFEMILDGRYLVEHYKSSSPSMGGDWEGMGILAFNNATGEYEHVWMDSGSTAMATSRGKPADDGSVQFHGTMVDPSTKAEIHTRVEFRMPSEDTRHMEMYADMMGQEMKMVEIDYTRATGG